MIDPADQSCPACGKTTGGNPRYPDYICRDCAAGVIAMDSRPIHFTNCNADECPAGTSVLGKYTDTNEIYPSDRCLIGKLHCQAKEARFGGVVIQPVDTWIKTGQWPHQTLA